MDTATGSGLMKEYDLMKHSKYRVYMSNIDKALKNFEYSSEWADLISALGKLNKVISSNSQFPIIPRRIKISKRLAQCMHPALPSGVHLKALESYDVIFSNIGVERLASELFIYSAGLFPLLGYSAMNVRPALLSIYEKYFVTLGERLRPALSGFLSGVFPGLESGQDHFDRTSSLLDQVCAAVNPDCFYTCLWECVVTNASVRLPAVSYVLDHFDKNSNLQQQKQLMGKCLELLVSGLCACLSDGAILVQRNTLEFLLLAFPMHTSAISNCDLIKLVKTGLNTILRRDMSLNRRLYSWLLGMDINLNDTDPADGKLSNQSVYFDEYSKNVLIRAFKLTLKSSINNTPIDLSPYRILISLLDKAEIGQKILDHVLCDVIRTITLCNGNTEVYKSANLLFSTFDPAYIWNYMSQLYRYAAKNIVKSTIPYPQVDSGPPNLEEVCFLTEYLLDTLSLEMYNETTRIYLPRFLLSITQMLTLYSENMENQAIAASLKLCIKIVTKVQPMNATPSKNIDSSGSYSSVDMDNSQQITDVIYLEKSNSDSKIHETFLQAEQIKRSNSNQNMGKKSPKNVKKTKKSKSYNKLSELEINKVGMSGEITVISTATSTPNLKNSDDEQKEIIQEKKQNYCEESSANKFQDCPILEKCIKQYVIFYEIYVCRKILHIKQTKATTQHTLNSVSDKIPTIFMEKEQEEYVNEEIIHMENNDRLRELDELFNTLRIEVVSSISKLKSVLSKSIDSEAERNERATTLKHRNIDVGQFSLNVLVENDAKVKDLVSMKISESLRSSLKLACNVLVDMSSFPNYDQNMQLNDIASVLPPWLKVLTLVCAYIKGDNELQIAAIQTLIDMISLLKTHIKNPKASSGITHVMMMPLLKISHVNYLESRTKVFQIITSMLWDYLNNSSIDLRRISLLLYQINNCLDNNFAENVVGNKMLCFQQNRYLQPNIANDKSKNFPMVWPLSTFYSTESKIDSDSLKKFKLLWHFGRESHHSKEFEMLLFMVLDNLALPRHVSIRISVVKWLKESLIRGDLGRILKPFFKILLNESTSRMSIIHTNVCKQEYLGNADGEKDMYVAVDSDNLIDKDCYAVSSEDGCIRYHIDNSSTKKRSPIRSFQKKIFGVSIGSKLNTSQTSNYITNNSSISDNIQDVNSFTKISVIINPLECATDSNETNDIPKDCDQHDEPDSSSDEESLYSQKKVNDGQIDGLRRFYGEVEQIDDNSGKTDRIRNRKSYSISTSSTCILDDSSSFRTNDVEKLDIHYFDPTSSSDSSVINVSSTDDNLQENKKDVWEQTQEAMAKSKINLEYLRKNSEHYKSLNKGNQPYNGKLLPFHTHLLVYDCVYDTKQVLYVFETLRNILTSDSRFFLCLSVTTSMSSNQIKSLLVRHRKNIFGKCFTDPIENTEYYNLYRGCMYLEVLITILLYYIRSYFQNDVDEKNNRATNEDIYGNCKVQLECIELLTIIFSELLPIVKDMGRSLASYISDLMDKCKVQKIILHCVTSSVHYFTTVHAYTFSEQLLNFNDPGEKSLNAESLQIQLLTLLLSIIKLEHELLVQSTHDKGNEKLINQLAQSPTKLNPENKPIYAKYQPNCPISQQPMFLTAILAALYSQKLQHIHKNWTDMITSSLTCLPLGSLTNIVISVIHQICINLDKISKRKTITNQSTDYIVSQLEAITVLSHYCLLDSTQQISLANVFNPMSNSSSVPHSGQIFNNIVNVFLSSSLLNVNQTKTSNQMVARNTVLSHLPRIIITIATLWETNISEFRNVKHQLLEFLSPISLHYGVNFLTAISVAWYERSESTAPADTIDKDTIDYMYIMTKTMPQANDNQLLLVKLISGIRIMSMDSFIQTLHQVVKTPPPIYNPPTGLNLDVSALELFYFYMKSVTATQLTDTWSSLYSLLKDSLVLHPPAQFVVLSILNEFVQRCPSIPFSDKKDLRDLHDITSKLVDAISIVAGACLEQTTWLRRNLSVKEEFSSQIDSTNIKDGSISISGNQQYSIQAQTILASVLSTLLDITYGSQEKDKVTTIVTTVMYNIVPYLKTHTTKNIPSFYACSNLLSSLSGYQYTRKAWRKDVLDLLLDSNFFQMDSSCLPFWKIILDSLMTCDNTTFRDLMNRLPLAQTGSLNIFTSKEQEYEQRALLLKRLAFVIFCSEIDQYHKYMPEIQEQLANSLRLPQVVPLIQAAVFLCFRVLLLRMSADHVTSLWPIIIAEMVQVFLSIEQELMTDTEELSQHIRMLSGLDTAWVTNTNNGMYSYGHPHWRMVQLETAKLLELGCVLPATILPHFQMYRWAFVSSQNEGLSSSMSSEALSDESKNVAFIPHVTRIAQLMDFRYTCHSPKSQSTKGSHIMLTCQMITTLQDLYSFFSTLSMRWPSHISYNDTGKDAKTCLDEIEKILSLDFLEKMPSK